MRNDDAIAAGRGGTQPFFPIRPLKSPILPIADTAHRVLVVATGRGACRWWGWAPSRSCGVFGRPAAPRRHRTACAADVPFHSTGELLSTLRALVFARSGLFSRVATSERCRETRFIWSDSSGTVVAPRNDSRPSTGEAKGRDSGDNSFAGVEKCVAGGMTARAAGAERSS